MQILTTQLQQVSKFFSDGVQKKDESRDLVRKGTWDGWREKKKGAGRMRGINDRETLISGPSGDFFVAWGTLLGRRLVRLGMGLERREVVKNCRWTRIDTLSLIEVRGVPGARVDVAVMKSRIFFLPSPPLYLKKKRVTSK